ncbi:MAG: hypothetical protein IK070_03100 [Clostridia bacterium]|nr:hypothetical protein [Clostridia bacterium]
MEYILIDGRYIDNIALFLDYLQNGLSKFDKEIFNPEGKRTSLIIDDIAKVHLSDADQKDFASATIDNPGINKAVQENKCYILTLNEVVTKTTDKVFSEPDSLDLSNKVKAWTEGLNVSNIEDEYAKNTLSYLLAVWNACKEAGEELPETTKVQESFYDKEEGKLYVALELGKTKQSINMECEDGVLTAGKLYKSFYNTGVGRTKISELSEDFAEEVLERLYSDNISEM